MVASGDELIYAGQEVTFDEEAEASEQES